MGSPVYVRFYIKRLDLSFYWGYNPFLYIIYVVSLT